MNRRGFLKGLLAAGIAAPIASKLSYVMASEGITDMLNVNGKVLDFGATHEGNGWYRIWKSFEPPKGERPELYFDLKAQQPDAWVSMGQIEQTAETLTASAYIKFDSEKTFIDNVSLKENR